ncbi:hypothetical protein GJAV_G00058480 [Gymnothorax javanicus]|nr:hypothetical protein GJAV_G00058480 [Gymnothorax javanicus]
MSDEVRRRRWNWKGHVLRKDRADDCAVALRWAPEGRTKRGRPKQPDGERWKRSKKVQAGQPGMQYAGQPRTESSGRRMFEPCVPPSTERIKVKVRATVATAKRHNVERHFTTCHKSYHANYPPGSALRAEKARELKAALNKQQSFFTRPAKNSQKATEASFRATHFLLKKKKAFSDGEVFKEAMMIIANTVLKDEKNGTDLLSTLFDVQLGASTMARRVSAMSGNLADQLDRDLAKCRWFSIQCDESVDSSSTAQLLVFIRMVFEDFSTKEELLTLLPLKTTTRGVDIYNAVKEFFVQKKVLLEKLVAVTTDGAPAMIGRHTGFIAHCKGDPDFPKFLHYHCIIHQQALCAKVIGFGHVMTPVVKIINSIRSKAKQHRIFKVLLEEMSAEYGDLLLHTEIRWLSRGRVLLRFLSLLGEIKEFMQSKGKDVSLLEDTEWTLDLAFLTDITGKLNHLNCELQGKAFSDMNFIKNKHRTRLTDAHLQDSLRVAVSSYTPDYNTLVNNMKCQSSH